MLNEIKVFRDPIYGYIKVYDELIWNLINAPEFQRLRRIRQLGGAYMVFHTAEHSRFSHSLGVYEVARQMIYNNKSIHKNLNEEECLLTLCAALLHDIGHCAFSHAFESVFDFNHEYMSIKIIEGHTHINKILTDYTPDFPKKIASIINKTHPNHIVVNIISGGLDADRLDYLERDSYFTGAKYGTIDLQRILRTLQIHNNELVVKESSLHTIEDFLLSRYHMFLQIYLHPTVRSFELILTNVFKRLKFLINNNFEFKSYSHLLQNIFKKDLTVNIDDYLALDDYSVLSTIKALETENDEVLKLLCSSFYNRYLFKYFEVKEDKIDEVYDEILAIFSKNISNAQYYLSKIILPVQRIYNFEHGKKTTNNIKILTKNNSIKNIAEVSPIFKSIKDFSAYEDVKIFYSDIIFKKLPESDQKKIEQIKARYLYGN